MNDLDRAIAAFRESIREGVVDWQVIRAGSNLLAALDAARGEAVYFTALPSGEYIQTKDDSLKEKGYRVVTAYLAPQAPPAPRVERYGDGVLVHWPEGVEQYVCVGDCVTGNLGAMAVPDGWTQAAEWLRNNYQDHPNIASLYRAMLSTANKENDNEHC